MNLRVGGLLIFDRCLRQDDSPGGYCTTSPPRGMVNTYPTTSSLYLVDALDGKRDGREKCRVRK